ncbi:hypothetical protein QUB17_03480 [Microcoleus sp. B5-C4]
MPVPQKVDFLVERASSPLLILVQDVSLNSDVALFSLNRLSGLFHNQVYFLWNGLLARC